MAEVRIPPPEPVPPDCPLCDHGTEVDADGDLICPACGIMWHWVRAQNWWGDGEPIDAHLPRCGVTTAPHPQSKTRYHCVRDAGHEVKRHAGVREDNSEYTWEWLADS